MKNFILILIGFFCFNLTNAQGLDTMVYNRLSPSAKQEIDNIQKLQNIKDQAKSYSEIAGYGKEIGIAVKEGLTAVKDVTIDLSKSDIGKTTIFLIIWKVAGLGMVRIAIGVLLMIVSIWLVAKSYFRTFRRRICIKDNGWFRSKEYAECANNEFWDYPDAAAGCHVLVLIILFAVAALIMFV